MFVCVVFVFSRPRFSAETSLIVHRSNFYVFTKVLGIFLENFESREICGRPQTYAENHRRVQYPALIKCVMLCLDRPISVQNHFPDDITVVSEIKIINIYVYDRHDSKPPFGLFTRDVTYTSLSDV